MKVKAPMLKLFGRDEQDLPALPIMSRHLIKMGEQSHLQGRSFGCTVVYSNTVGNSVLLTTSAGRTWSPVQLRELASQRFGVRRRRACHPHLSINGPLLDSFRLWKTRCSTGSRSVSPVAMQRGSTLGATKLFISFVLSPYTIDPAPEPSVRRALLLEPRLK
jgi:hypothetical protein